MPERVGDQATMEPPKFERCSILLTFQKLMISDSNRTTELWTKQPRRDGGTRVGAIWGSAEGAALQRFGCERITPGWDALSSFAHFPNLPTSEFSHSLGRSGRAVRWSGLRNSA